MFVRDADRVPHPAVQWSSAPQVKVVGAWPESMALPGSLGDRFSTQRLQDFLVKTLHTFAGAVDVNNKTVDVLNLLCPRYTHREIAAAKAEMDHNFRQNPLPQRYHWRRPPPLLSPCCTTCPPCWREYESEELKQDEKVALMAALRKAGQIRGPEKSVYCLSPSK